MQFENLESIPSVKKYLDRIGAESRSLLVAVIKEEGSAGYWRDTHVIKFTKEGDITVTPENNPLINPTGEEATLIKNEFGGIQWPEAVFIEDVNDKSLPSMWLNATDENKFVYRDENKNVVMLQLRIDDRKGKKYVPISKWSDGKYRFAEPGEKLPLFGLEHIKKSPYVLIVEGAKTARFVQWMIDGETAEARQALENHPWGDKLKAFTVVGWASGALSPARTDWSAIKNNGIVKAYVALDNDEPGRAALPQIAKALRCVTHAIEFSQEWPASADLFDPFPPVFFKEIDSRKYYIGPSFDDCTYPATYMTDLIVVPDGKKEKTVPVLRSHAKNLYQWVEETGSFCYLDMPHLSYSAETIDNVLRPFSDTRKVSELILQNFNGRITSFDYSPATKKRRIIVNGKAVINLYNPSSIKPQYGDPKPWLEFVEQLIPKQEEREHLLRWVATLYAHPEIRMIWSPLLISTQTGTGKSTLGQIVAELAGRHNASFPSEQVIAGEFNSWIAQKRLVVVNEIYQGQSWKMFTKLKDLISEPLITLRKMHRDPIDISNWAHFLMFSNSLAALRIDAQDRRIFAPTVTEERWPDDKWHEFHNWLSSGGYSIIAQWCLDYGDYVKRGERAPETERKYEIIEASQSKAHQRIEELSGMVRDDKNPIVLSLTHVIEWIEQSTKSKVYETPLQIRKLFGESGLVDAKDLGLKSRISYKSHLTYFLLNKKAVEMTSGLCDKELTNKLKEFVKQPNQILNEDESVV